MSRFVISYLLPPSIGQQVTDAYARYTGHPLSITHLHVTIVPTFFLRPSVTLSQIHPYIRVDDRLPACSFGPPAFFTSLNKSILYLPLIPPEPLRELHSVLCTRYSELIDFDLSVYDHRQLPAYLPHVSLDYNFTGNQDQAKTWTFLPAGTTFTLDQLVLFQETTPGRWEIV